MFLKILYQIIWGNALLEVLEQAYSLPLFAAVAAVVVVAIELLQHLYAYEAPQQIRIFHLKLPHWLLRSLYMDLKSLHIAAEIEDTLQIQI